MNQNTKNVLLVVLFVLPVSAFARLRDVFVAQTPKRQKKIYHRHHILVLWFIPRNYDITNRSGMF